MRFLQTQKRQIFQPIGRFETFYYRHRKYLAGFIQKPGGSKQLPALQRKCFIH
jgi:hypothetical protein